MLNKETIKQIALDLFFEGLKMAPTTRTATAGLGKSPCSTTMGATDGKVDSPPAQVILE